MFAQKPPPEDGPFAYELTFYPSWLGEIDIESILATNTLDYDPFANSSIAKISSNAKLQQMARDQKIMLDEVTRYYEQYNQSIDGLAQGIKSTLLFSKKGQELSELSRLDLLSRIVSKIQYRVSNGESQQLDYELLPILHECLLSYANFELKLPNDKLRYLANLITATSSLPETSDETAETVANIFNRDLYNSEIKVDLIGLTEVQQKLAIVASYSWLLVTNRYHIGKYRFGPVRQHMLFKLYSYGPHLVELIQKESQEHGEDSSNTEISTAASYAINSLVNAISNLLILGVTPDQFEPLVRMIKPYINPNVIDTLKLEVEQYAEDPVQSLRFGKGIDVEAVLEFWDQLKSELGSKAEKIEA